MKKEIVFFGILLVLLVALMGLAGCATTVPAPSGKLAIANPLEKVTEAPVGMPASVFILAGIVASEVDCATYSKGAKWHIVRMLAKEGVRRPDHIKLIPLYGSTICGLASPGGLVKIKLTLSWNQIGDDELWRYRVIANKLFAPFR